MRLDLFVAMDALAEIVVNMAVGYKKGSETNCILQTFKKIKSILIANYDP